MKHIARWGVVTAVVVGAVAFASPASAHVTLSETEAEAGEHVRVDLRVPNESEKANTTEVKLTLPKDQPLTSVSTKPVQGWSVSTKTAKLDKPVKMHGREFDEAVSTVTWTAKNNDDGIKPGEFNEFGLSMGPVPEDVGATMVFKALQTYSDGEEAPWIEAPKKGEPEPEHPAPTLTVVAAPKDASATENADASDAESSQDSSSVPILGIVSIAIAVAALVLAALAYRKKVN